MSASQLRDRVSFFKRNPNRELNERYLTYTLIQPLSRLTAAEIRKILGWSKEQYDRLKLTMQVYYKSNHFGSKTQAVMARKWDAAVAHCMSQRVLAPYRAIHAAHNEEGKFLRRTINKMMIDFATCMKRDKESSIATDSEEEDDDEEDWSEMEDIDPPATVEPEVMEPGEEDAVAGIMHCPCDSN